MVLYKLSTSLTYLLQSYWRFHFICDSVSKSFFSSHLSWVTLDLLQRSDVLQLAVQLFKYLPARQLCCKQVLFLVASVCTKSRQLPVGNWCNLVGICPTVNTRSGYKLVTFDLERYFGIFSAYTFRMALLCNFIFGVELCQYPGHGSKVKVTAAKKW